VALILVALSVNERSMLLVLEGNSVEHPQTVCVEETVTEA